MDLADWLDGDGGPAAELSMSWTMSATEPEAEDPAAASVPSPSPMGVRAAAADVLAPAAAQTTGDARSLVCTVCGRQFPDVDGSRSNLLRHMRSHSGERPHVCTQCPQAFTTLHNLRRHIVARHPGSPVPPSRAVSRTGTPLAMGAPNFPPQPPTVAASVPSASPSESAPAADESLASVLGSLPLRHACAHCDKSFAYKTSLQYHLRQKHPEHEAETAAAATAAGPVRGLEMECPHCFTLLSSRAKLTRHLQKHCLLRHEAPARKRNRGELSHFDDASNGCESDGDDDMRPTADRTRRLTRCDHDGCFASFTTSRGLRQHRASAHGSTTETTAGDAAAAACAKRAIDGSL
jgi:uncharacterized Zn-finger protein